MFNNSFQFANWNAEVVNARESKPGLKISGVPYLSMGPLEFVEGGEQIRPRNNQVYILDDETALETRKRFITNTDIKKDCDFIHSVFHDFITKFNVFATGLQMAYQEIKSKDRQDLKIVLGENKTGDKTFDKPSVNEVAAIFNEKEVRKYGIDVYIKPKQGNKGWSSVKTNDHNYEPVGYPLIFPRGERGWAPEKYYSKTGKKVSLLEYVRYHCQYREGKKNYLLNLGAVSRQYLLDMYLRHEHNIYMFQLLNQEKLNMRRDYYNNVEAGDKLEDTGTKVLMTSSIPGTPKWLKKKCDEALALHRQFGKPCLFITMTCNSAWPELRTLPMMDDPVQQHPKYNPMLLCRVFNHKKEKLLKLIYKYGIFGEVLGKVHVIEFQKRGLPHCHLIVWLKEQDKLDSIDKIDQAICAEIPREDEPELRELVVGQLIHGPCGDINPYSPCMKVVNGVYKCSKGFPKPYNNRTYIGENSLYPEYMRRSPENGGGQAEKQVIVTDPETNKKTVKTVTIDSKWVIPYNKLLTKYFKCHINVEKVASISCFKYIFKYICKGTDKSIYQLVPEEQEEGEKKEINEIQRWRSGRYVGDVDSAWHLLEQKLHGQTPAAMLLDIHLPNEQSVYYEIGEDKEKVLKRSSRTMLTEWFTLNREDEEARRYTYREIVYFFNWVKSKRQWQRWKEGEKDEENNGLIRHDKIGYFPTILPKGPNGIERFALSMLLIYVTGPMSFEDIRTVDGVVYPSYQEAAQKLGLMENDSEIYQVLEEVFEISSGHELRRFFAILLENWIIEDPQALWDANKDILVEDFVREENKKLNPVVDMDRMYLKGLECINTYLEQLGTNLSELKITVPEGLELNENNDGFFYKGNVNEASESVYGTLNNGQRECFDTIMTAVCENPGQFYFLDAPGGTGKTYLLNALIEQLSLKGKKVCVTASSGIASILLKGGSTLHRKLKIPINCTDEDSSKIKKQTKLCGLIKEMDLLIWDEAPMFEKTVLECVDRSLKDLRNSNKIFGGVTVVLSGDWRQLLPVIINGDRPIIVDSTHKRSELWENVNILHLSENMRVSLEDSDGIWFRNWLMDLGEGKLNKPDKYSISDEIEIPDRLIFKGESISDLVDTIFPDLYINIGERNYCQWINERAIIVSTNRDVEQINDYCLSKLPGEEYLFMSIDTPMEDQKYSSFQIPIDLLNTLNEGGLPPCELRLKVGAPVQLLRNIVPNDGHCNGTRYVIKKINRRTLELEVDSGPNKGKIFICSKMEILSTGGKHKINFKRKQFPVRLAFAFTAHKAQGQSFNHVGIYARNDFFAHGQFYVAASRVTNPNNLHIMLRKESNVTKNVVYDELLD